MPKSTIRAVRHGRTDRQTLLVEKLGFQEKTLYQRYLLLTPIPFPN